MTFRLALAALTAAFLPLSTSGLRAGEVRIAALDDAFVIANQDIGQWIVGNRNIRLTVEVDRNGALSFGGLQLADGTAVTTGRDSDALVTLNGVTTGLGVRGGPLFVDGVTASNNGNGVELQVHLRPDSGT